MKMIVYLNVYMRLACEQEKIMCGWPTQQTLTAHELNTIQQRHANRAANVPTF